MPKIRDFVSSIFETQKVNLFYKTLYFWIHLTVFLHELKNSLIPFQQYCKKVFLYQRLCILLLLIFFIWQLLYNLNPGVHFENFFWKIQKESIINGIP